LLTVLAVASACADPAPAEADATASFTASVSGGTTRQLAGQATFDIDVPGSEYGLTIGLVHPVAVAGRDGMQHAIWLAHPSAGAPAPGAYDIRNDGTGSGFDAMLVLDADSAEPLACDATAGTVHVDHVSTTRISGRFTLSAECSSMTTVRTAKVSVSGAFAAAPGTLESPAERAQAVGGATYVLTAVNGAPSPFLLLDYTIPNDGTRLRRWLVADTVRFGVDGRLSYFHWYRDGEQPPGAQEDLSEWGEWSGGYFRQQGASLAVAWNWISVPPDSGYADTLRVRHNRITRMVTLPRACVACLAGQRVPFTYSRAAGVQ
jgi:hypothetical protein